MAAAPAVPEMGRPGFPVPYAWNRVMEGSAGETQLEVAGTSDVAPFVFQVTMATEHLGAVQRRLVDAGAHAATPEALELARILAGWPRLASEVDEKTIPQEVGFDEIGGGAYTKGCYTRPETGSRLHFRGAANRHLRGLPFATHPPPPPARG